MDLYAKSNFYIRYRYHKINFCLGTLAIKQPKKNVQNHKHSNHNYYIDQDANTTHRLVLRKVTFKHSKI